MKISDSIAQRKEHWPSKPGVDGSNPSGVAKITHHEKAGLLRGQVETSGEGRAGGANSPRQEAEPKTGRQDVESNHGAPSQFRCERCHNLFTGTNNTDEVCRLVGFRLCEQCIAKVDEMLNGYRKAQREAEMLPIRMKKRREYQRKTMKSREGKGPEWLRKTEMRILELVMEGKTCLAISKIMRRSVCTVRTHTRNICLVLGARSITQSVAIYLRHKLQSQNANQDPT